MEFKGFDSDLEAMIKEEVMKKSASDNTKNTNEVSGSGAAKGMAAQSMGTTAEKPTDTDSNELNGSGSGKGMETQSMKTTEKKPDDTDSNAINGSGASKGMADQSMAKKSSLKDEIMGEEPKTVIENGEKTEAESKAEEKKEEDTEKDSKKCAGITLESLKQAFAGEKISDMKIAKAIDAVLVSVSKNTKQASAEDISKSNIMKIAYYLLMANEGRKEAELNVKKASFVERLKKEAGMSGDDADEYVTKIAGEFDNDFEMVSGTVDNKIKSYKLAFGTESKVAGKARSAEQDLDDLLLS